MRQQTTRFIGSCVIAAIPLTFVMWATLELLRRDYSPWRNLLNDYLVGRFSFLGVAAACMLAATFVILVVGLQRSVRPSAFLAASCVLLGFVAVSLGLTAAFPTDAWRVDGGRPAVAGVLDVFSQVRFCALVIALLLTLPAAFKRDEKWRSLSRVTLSLGVLMLALGVVAMLAPLELKPLVQRGAALAILIWFLLTGWRLRKVVSSSQGCTA